MRVSSIGNGKMLINFDEKGRIIDIYYPYVGLENQTGGEPIRIAIWDGKNLFLDDMWRTEISYLDNSNIVEIRSEIPNTNISVISYNFLDNDEPIYYSIIKVVNNNNVQKNLKLFFIHNINLYSNPFGDTAFYDPYTFSIIHYKSKRYLGFKAFSSSFTFSEYNIGKGNLIDDLYDGYLGLNAIDNGDVNSSLGIEMKIDPNSFT
ncbi:MAG: glycoside hydrolase family 15 protein, partial [Saccharolobus sp.]